ncbi:glyoxal reductase, partial [Haematococcus lacustris]
MPLPASIQLRNGVALPTVGLGTFKASGQELVTAVQAALAVGIRHIDTAEIYKNQEQIMQGIRAAGVPRSE